MFWLKNSHKGFIYVFISTATIPQFKYPCYRPGLNNLGFSHLVYNHNTDVINSITAHTFKSESAIAGYESSQYLDDRTIKLLAVKDHFNSIITTNLFDIIVCEAPFFYPGKPQAYKALVEAINTMKLHAASIAPMIPFIQLEPLMVKRHVKSLNISSKDSTKDALKLLDIEKYIDLDSLDEHAVDSISVGFAFLKSRDFLGEKDVSA